jgi:Glyoxalase-like domain
LPLAVRNLTFTSADPTRLADLWAAAGCVQRRDRAEAVLLAPQDRSFSRVSFQHCTTPTSGPGPCAPGAHRRRHGGTGRSLTGLGATKLWTIDMTQAATTTWSAMRDLDGYKFCVVQQPPGE